MSATRLYRIAAVLFVLFAAGHTYGFLTLKPPTQESLAVWDGMNHVRFSMEGSSASYSFGEFYRAFGLTITAEMLFTAFLCWELGRLARTYPKAVGGIGWALCAAQAAGFGVSLIYLGGPPTAFSGVATALLGWAAFSARRGARD